ncbi:hypothetical protein PhCBS80983_g04321 [Powellomyces hirtus]|uniref:Uncharacterized protein n=1 Tax=Powellomyces hirtus TaxID=109895 RepID=A0A507DY63_9FUNG|nr:hypothetical protein PhCBS80983_g04321 [Powellomyces hirtus]
MSHTIVAFLVLLWVLATASTGFRVSFISTSGTSPNYTTVQSRNYGGYAALSTAVSNLKTSLSATSVPYIALHGMNAIGFSTFSQYYKGFKEHIYLDAIGFQYITFGTRDFFYGPNMYANNFLATSPMTCIASNVLVSKSLPLSSYVHPYSVLNLTDSQTNQQAKFAIVAYTVQTFCSLSQCAEPVNGVAQIKVDDVIRSMTDFMKELLFVEKPDVVVALSSGTEFAFDVAVAKSVPGLDIILTSDDKATTTVPTVVQGTDGQNVLLVSDMTNLGFHGLARLDVTFANGAPTTWNVTVDPIMTCQGDPSPLSGCVTPNATMLQTLETDVAPILASLGVVVGSISTKLDGRQAEGGHPCRIGECAAGSALADAMLWQMGAQCDAAIVNGGSIRASLGPGPITMSDIGTMLPNANNIAIARLRGADVFDALANGLSRIYPASGAGRFPQVANINMTFNSANPGTLRLVSAQIYDQNQKTYVDIDPTGVYNLCVNDYMLNGGDGYTMLMAKSLYNFRQGAQLDVILKAYFKAKSPLPAPVGGRMANLVTQSSGASPPLIGSCTFSTTTNTTAGKLSDICDNGYRHTTDLTWTIAPANSPRSIYLTFSNFTFNGETDTLYLIDVSTKLPILVPSASAHGMVPANYTALPDAVGAPNMSAVAVRLVLNRPIEGSGLSITYTSDEDCPGGYILRENQCTACSAGTHVSKGKPACTPCMAGWVAPSEGLANCILCEKGTYNNVAGSTRCQSCDGGRLGTSPTQCDCPDGKVWNGLTCLQGHKSEAGPIAGVAVGVIVVAAATAYFVYRRRMATMKRRQQGVHKQKQLKTDVAMNRILQDIGHMVFEIALDCVECFLDWHAFLTVDDTDKYRIGFIVACIFQSLITFLSAAIRLYNIKALCSIRSKGVRLIAAGATTTSAEALRRIKSAETDADLHLALLNLKALRQKVIVTTAVAFPGVLKSLPMLIVSALIAKQENQGDGFNLLIAFGFNVFMFSVNCQQTLGWVTLKHSYLKQKRLTDARLNALGLQRPDAAHAGTRSLRSHRGRSEWMIQAAGGAIYPAQMKRSVTKKKGRATYLAQMKRAVTKKKGRATYLAQMKRSATKKKGRVPSADEALSDEEEGSNNIPSADMKRTATKKMGRTTYPAQI